MAGKSVPKVKQKLDKKDLTLSLAFLLPAILITVIFVIYPVFDTVGLSFRKWNGMFGAAKQWVGLENYQKIFSDKLFWNAMLNSVYFMIGGFVILMPLSFGLAMLVTAKIKGTGFFRTCYFLPNMLGTTAVALMWTFMLNPNFGIFNTIENIFGLHGTIPDVLTIKTVNVWIVVLVNEWMYAGYNMLIFAAGLVAIPDELNEAAALDGATGWQRIRYIILPLMKNSFKVFSILCITGCLKVFDIIWAMTRGGPNDISSTPSIMLYTQGFSYKLFGRSSGCGYWDAGAATMAKLRARIDNDPKPLERLARRLNKSKFVLSGEEFKRPKGDAGKLLNPWYNRKNIAIGYDDNPEGVLFTPQLKDNVLDGFHFLMPYYQYLDTLAGDMEPNR